MMYLSRPRMAAVLLGIVALAPWVSAQDKPTVAVAPTEASRIADWQPAMSEGLAEMFVTELTKLPNIQVLESLDLEDIRKERALGENGEVAEDEAVKKGGFGGADYTFRSKITRFASKTTRSGGGGWGPPIPFGPGGGGVDIRRSTSEVQIDWRIIDNASREVVASGRGQGTEVGKGFNIGGWGGGGFSNDQEFLDSALGKATMKAIAQIMTSVSAVDLKPGARSIAATQRAATVLSALRGVLGEVKLVEEKEIWVSLGSAQTFKVGEKVAIYKPIQKKNKKGEIIATTYQKAGEITLTKVQKDKSVGSYDGTQTIEEGWGAADPAVDIETLAK